MVKEIRKNYINKDDALKTKRQDEHLNNNGVEAREETIKKTQLKERKFRDQRALGK